MRDSSTLVCPHCGASCRSDVTVCWLCHQRLAGGVAPPPLTGRQGRSTSREDQGPSGVAILLVFVFLLSGVSVFSRGLAFLFAIVLIPVGLSSLPKNARPLPREVPGAGNRWLRWLLVACQSVALLVSLMFGLALIAFVVVFVSCLYHPPRF